MPRTSTGYVDPTIDRKVERALPRVSSKPQAGMDFSGITSGLLRDATAAIPRATTSQGWTRGEANARNQSRAIQARRQANDLLSRLLQTQMQGGTQRAVQEMANKGRMDVTGLTEQGATERAKMKEQGATGRTEMTTQTQLERQRLADEAASGRLGQELGWKGQEAERRREWLGNQELMKSNRGLVSDILQRGGTVTPELGNIYNMPEGFTPSWEGMAGQQLVPTAPQRPLGYAEGQRLMTDEQGKPLYKGNRPVYERYLYNKETGQPYTPSTMMQGNLNPQAMPQPSMPSPAMPQAPATAETAQPTKKKYDLNQYYR